MIMKSRMNWVKTVLSLLEQNHLNEHMGESHEIYSAQ